MRKFNLNKYKPYFYIFIIAEIFLFSIYYIFSNQIADNTFYLQLRRFLPCALGISIALYFWRNLKFPIINLTTHVVISLFWIITFPLCYYLTFSSNTVNISNHFDIVFGAYAFTFTTLLYILLMLLFNNYKSLINIFLSLFQFSLLSIPLLQTAYYLYYGTPITTAAALAFLQTNKNEATEYLLQNFSYIGIITIIIFAIIIFTLLYRLNKLPSIKIQYTKKTIIILTIILSAIGSYSCKMIFRTGVLQAYSFADIYLKSSQKFASYHDSNFKNLIVSPDKPVFSKPSTIIIIIGESASRNFMSAYNDTKNDTAPWLKEKLNDNNFTIFKNAYTSWVQTVPSLERALTEKNQYNDIEFNQSITWIDIAKKAGYKTYWFSNQGTISDADTPITLVAKTADYSYWLEDTLAISDKIKYDGDLVEYLKHVNPNENNFIVFHLMGSHENCFNRYPPEENKFALSDEHDMVLTYDNSLAYTDKVIESIFNISKQNLNLQAMVYFSDHGGNPYRKRHPDEGGFISLRIPFFIYTSNEYNVLYPETYKIMKKNENQYFTNDLMYEVVCNLLQITSNHYNSENSILSPNYKFNQNNLTTMLGKRKLTEDTNQ